MCDEARGIGSVLVADDDRCSAFVAREQRPANRGQVLVVTRDHHADLYDAPPDIVAHLFTVVRQVAWAVQEATGADGTTIHQNNRPPGQEVFHLHVHVFPRFHGDAFSTSIPEPVDLVARQAIADRIVEVLASDEPGQSNT